jgi:hypothetical protein
MYDVNKICITTRGGDRYMVTVIGGWMVLDNITKAERGVERKEQLALHESEWKYRYLRRKMTVGVIDGAWRITPESCSVFFDIVGNKQVGLNQLNLPIFGKHPGTAAHVPGAQGDCQKSPQKLVCLKNKNGTATILQYMRHIQFGSDNAQNTWMITN